jgi:hypothetical protein
MPTFLTDFLNSAIFVAFEAFYEVKNGFPKQTTDNA